MDYDTARNQIRSGDLLAWTSKKWNSWYAIQVQMVRLFTQSEYCHVGIAWVFGGRVFVIESVTSGIRIVPLSKELPCYWVATDTEWTHDAEEYAMGLIGAPYSKLRAIRDGLGLSNDYSPGHAWTCAQFVIAMFNFMKFVLNCRPTPSLIVQSTLESDKTLRLIEA